MTTKREINVRLLRRIQKHILAEPRRLDMNNWGSVFAAEAVRRERRYLPPCRTAGCIAGTACILAGLIEPKKLIRKLEVRNSGFDYISALRFPLNTPDKARKALGLTREQGRRLFLFSSMAMSSNHWPESFESQYELATTPRQRARVAANRIDHFIQTGGAE